MAVFLRQCHFQDLPFYLKSHNLRTKNVHCLASPGRVSALALQSEASVNKEKHSLCNFVALQSGGASQRNSSLTFADTKRANFENYIASE